MQAAIIALALWHNVDAVQLANRKSMLDAAPVSYSHCGRSVETLKNVGDGSLYLGKVSIGQGEYAALYDTGSFEVMVEGSKCSKCGGKLYDHEKTGLSQFNMSQPKRELNYASGAVTVLQGRDTVKMGGCKAHFSRVAEIVDHDVNELRGADISAVVGIGPLNEDAPERAISQLGIDAYSMCFPNEKGADGQIVWGEDVHKDKSHAKKFNTLTLIGDLHWATQLTNFGLKNPYGTDSVSICTDSCAAIVDSGTSFLTVTQEALDIVEKAVGKDGFSCGDMSHLPHLRFELDGQVHMLPPSAYVMKATEEIPSHIEEMLYFKPRAARGTGLMQRGQCLLLFTAPLEVTSAAGPVMVLGMSLFRHYYTTFNLVERTMHTASHQGCDVQGLKKPSLLEAESESYVREGDPAKLVVSTKVRSFLETQGQRSLLQKTRPYLKL